MTMSKIAIIASGLALLLVLAFIGGYEYSYIIDPDTVSQPSSESPEGSDPVAEGEQQDTRFSAFGSAKSRTRILCPCGLTMLIKKGGWKALELSPIKLEIPQSVMSGFTTEATMVQTVMAIISVSLLSVLVWENTAKYRKEMGNAQSGDATLRIKKSYF